MFETLEQVEGVGVEGVEGWKDEAKKTFKADATCPTALSQTRL